MAQPSLATVESVLAPYVATALKDASPVPNSPCTCIEVEGSRRLVVCIDGTSNQFSKYNTNVVELYNRLKKDTTQLTYYNSGIGTYAKPSWVSLTYVWQWISSAIDLVFARRIDRSVKQAYQWLSEQYRPGDRIYLFGFSRGAYQVRILAAMIDSVGLLHKGNLDQIPFAYRLYVTSQDDSEPSQRSADSIGGGGATPVASPTAAQSTEIAAVVDEAQSTTGSESTSVDEAQSTTGSESTSDSKAAPEPEPTTKEVLASFKKAFSHENVRVHFVGVWDTVSSVGIFYNKTLPGTTTGMDRTCFFRHALALHERRVRFLPEYAYGGTGHTPSSPLGADVQGPVNRPVESPNAGGIETTTPVTTPRIKEVWFQGCHSDIGGGNIPNVKLQIFAPALRWMCFEARTAGLEFNPPPEVKWARRSKVHDSMSLGWRIVEYIPLTHRSYRNTGSGHDETWWRCHRAAPRVIAKDHLVHATALPLSKAKKTTLWSILRARGETEKIPRPVATFAADSSQSWEQVPIEEDPYTDAEKVVSFLSGLRGAESLQTLNSKDARLLKVLLSTEPGRISLRTAARARPDSRALKLLYLLFYVYIPALPPTGIPDQEALRRLEEAAPDVHRTLAPSRQVLRRLPFGEMIPVLRQLQDEEIKAAKDGLGNCPITVAQTIPRLVNIDDNTSIPWIAYTEQQHKLSCVSASFGLSSWNVHDYGSVHLLGPRRVPRSESPPHPMVACAALSYDGRFLLTSTSTGLLQQWSVETGEQRLQDIQIDIRQGPNLYSRSEPIDPTTLDGTEAAVSCLALSRDGRKLVIAWTVMYERVFAIYDLAAVLDPNRSPFAPTHIRPSAHSWAIKSVACSPHDSSILTASWDETVKLWRADDHGEVQCVQEFKGHTSDVNHAAYSPANKRLIVSGSDDCTVIVWDTTSGQPHVPPFRGHEDFVYCVAFSPDATKVVSGSLDCSVRLWETATGKQLGVYRGHSDGIICVAFKDDGSQFASSSRDGTVLQWDEWSDSELDKAIEEYRASQKAPKNDTAS